MVAPPGLGIYLVEYLVNGNDFNVIWEKLFLTSIYRIGGNFRDTKFSRLHNFEDFRCPRPNLYCVNDMGLYINILEDGDL